MYTLLELLNFTPLNETEKKHYYFDQSMISKIKMELEKDCFYLGGQIKMNRNDIIDLYAIENVKKIYEQRMRDYGGPCNSFEAASIFNSQKELEFVETMIKSYNLIMEIRKLESNNL